MRNDSALEWEVRLREYAENLDAVKGKEYTETLVTWAHVAYLLASYVPDQPPGSTQELAMTLAKQLNLDDKDMFAVLSLFSRADSALWRDR